MDAQNFTALNELLLAARGENNSCIARTQTEREKVRVLREAVHAIFRRMDSLETYDAVVNDICEKSLATTAPEAGEDV